MYVCICSEPSYTKSHVCTAAVQIEGMHEQHGKGCKD